MYNLALQASWCCRCMSTVHWSRVRNVSDSGLHFGMIPFNKTEYQHQVPTVPSFSYVFRGAIPHWLFTEIQPTS
jgi:hypothetical protein